MKMKEAKIIRLQILKTENVTVLCAFLFTLVAGRLQVRVIRREGLVFCGFFLNIKLL